MNVMPPEPGDTSALRRQLGALPDPPPPDPLFERILRSRDRRRRMRRLGAGCALLLLGAVLAPWFSPPRSPSGMDTEAMHQAPAPARSDLELLLLDRRLQAAYDRGASAEQLNALWQARARVLARSVPTPPSEETVDAHILAL